MYHEQARRVCLAADPGGPASDLWSSLSLAEQERVMRLPTERQRRQSALARHAGHSAIERVLGSTPGSRVEIAQARNHAPLVSIDGRTDIASLSLAHSGRLAAAAAWRNEPDCSNRAGVDLEQIRSCEIASSSYAFSRRERELIINAPLERDRSSLAAWTAKEAAWKALRPEPECGPDTVELLQLDLERGGALVRPSGRLRGRFRDTVLTVSLSVLVGPDGEYWLALAGVDPWPTEIEGHRVESIAAQSLI